MAHRTQKGNLIHNTNSKLVGLVNYVPTKLISRWNSIHSQSRKRSLWQINNKNTSIDIEKAFFFGQQRGLHLWGASSPRRGRSGNESCS